MEFFKKKIKICLTLSVLIVFFPGAVRPLCNFLRELYCMGVAVLLDARTILIATRLRLLPFLAMLDGVRTLSTNLCSRLSSGRELDVAFAAARCGENNCNGHLLEFKSTLLVAELGSSLHCLNSLNSLNCHPSMHSR